MSKKCADCGCEVNRNVIQGMYYCPRCDDDKSEREVLPLSLFDRLTASPEVLAPKFVYHVTSFLDGLDKPKKVWYSTLINNQYFNTELEAKRATVAKLNEVYNETTSN